MWTIAQVGRLLMFRDNIWLLIGAIIAILLLVLVVLGLFLAVRILLWKRSVRRAAEQALRAKVGPDGQPLPPMAAGICNRCRRAFDAIYYLPTGQKLCPRCHAAATGLAEAEP